MFALIKEKRKGPVDFVFSKISYIISNTEVNLKAFKVKLIIGGAEQGFKEDRLSRSRCMTPHVGLYAIWVNQRPSDLSAMKEQFA